MHWYLARGKRKPKFIRRHRTHQAHLQITNSLPTPETDQAHSSHVHPPTLIKGCEDLEARESQLMVIVAQQGWRWDFSLPSHDLQVADCQHSRAAPKSQQRARARY